MYLKIITYEYDLNIIWTWCMRHFSLYGGPVGITSFEEIQGRTHFSLSYWDNIFIMDLNRTCTFLFCNLIVLQYLTGFLDKAKVRWLAPCAKISISLIMWRLHWTRVIDLYTLIRPLLCYIHRSRPVTSRLAPYGNFFLCAPPPLGHFFFHTFDKYVNLFLNCSLFRLLKNQNTTYNL